MNILFVGEGAFDPQVGGVERVTFILSRELIVRGYNVYHLVLPLSNNKSNENFIVKTFYLPNKNPLSEENITYYHNFINQFNIDIVINQRAGIITEPLSKLFCNIGSSKCKLISVFHEPPTFSLDACYSNILHYCKNRFKITILSKFLSYIFFPKSYLKERIKLSNFYNELFSHSDRVCVLTRKDKTKLTSLIKHKYIHKLLVIGNPNTYELIQSENNTSLSKENLILYVGRFTKKDKRPDRILEIWEMIYDKNPNWKLLMIGDGEMMPQLKEKSTHMKRVFFQGQTDPKPFYDRAKIVCNTSNFEGWGMVFTEAICRKCVPVSFDNVGIKDEIKLNPEQLIHAYSLTEYAQKLSNLMRNENLRIRVLQNNIEHVKNFEPRFIVSRWIEVFNSLQNS